MHVIFREQHGLDGAEVPIDLAQDPADLVVLSFSDSDLGAFAAGWRRARDAGMDVPSLRLANLAGLRHPLAVDTYIERTLAHARGILIRLIGGEPYWSYGLSEVHALARRAGIALAVLPADGRPDPRLDALSTLPGTTLARLAALCEAGGPAAAEAALAQLAVASGLPAWPVPGHKTVPPAGWYRPGQGPLPAPPRDDRPLAVVTCYRSMVMAADDAPVAAMLAGLEARGFRAAALFVTSFKDPAAAAWADEALAADPPAVIVNATSFSSRSAGGRSPLDQAAGPVFQVALASSQRSVWWQDSRGLSPADLAMHVVLPEVDGHIFAGAVSFKQPESRDPALQFARWAHGPEPDRVAAALDRVAAWHRLAATPRAGRRLALVLSTYPGRADQRAHALGLDAPASVAAVLALLAAEGYAVTPVEAIAERLGTMTLSWPVAAYRRSLAALPAALHKAVHDAWGAAEDDPAVQGGCFRFAALRAGEAIVALQPERGDAAFRRDGYHDMSAVPRHGYVAFYLWLRALGLHALIHMGTHGTLEWLPGKSAGLSAQCWPDALAGALPVIYPFIVNDPGEAAQAKRRLGAVTIGHLPPPQRQAWLPERLVPLERLLDEFSTADGLDPRRRSALVGAILDEAGAQGLAEELGITADLPAGEAIPRIDRFLCDLKDSQFGDGLHIFGEGRCGAEEREGLLAALDGRRVAAGPAGSPWRGRQDVLPTGRNLYGIDPRTVPTRMAHGLGIRRAEELIRRHVQDHGDWPRAVVVELWGSATMRTAGEDWAMALHLAGAEPCWDSGTGRVRGFAILPLAVLGRPRVAVTLRISGLFRDAFAQLAQLFAELARTLGKRRDEGADNPYATNPAAPRVFGPRPGHFGLGLGSLPLTFTDAARDAAGEQWLAAGGWAVLSSGEVRWAAEALRDQVMAANAHLLASDVPEADVLMAADWMAHHGGFAAAAARLGNRDVALYHLDASRPETPVVRRLVEEIGRTVRARAAHPAWVDGMMRHGFRGAAEILATLDHLAMAAQLTRDVPGHLLDLYHEATLGRPDVVAFMETAHAEALALMRERFLALHEAGLWETRRNSIRESLHHAQELTP